MIPDKEDPGGPRPLPGIARSGMWTGVCQVEVAELKRLLEEEYKLTNQLQRQKRKLELEVRDRPGRRGGGTVAAPGAQALATIRI